MTVGCEAMPVFGPNASSRTRGIHRIWPGSPTPARTFAMLALSHALRRPLAHWWVCGALCAASLLFFLWLVPDGVTAGRTLAPRILNEYVMTWTPDDARRFLQAIGPVGREAYRRFYLDLDFWFPVLTLACWYSSLLALAYPAGSRWARLNLLPFVMWLSNAAEKRPACAYARRACFACSGPARACRRPRASRSPCTADARRR